jgi:Ca2+-binding RTX toxin-like protein
MANAATSAELRTLIQNANSLDPIINLTTATPPGSPYSVITLGKTSSNISEPAFPFSGYTIQSSVPLTPPARGASTATQLTREFSNTRIYQQNIDGPYSPSLIKDVEFIYSSGSDALLSARTGNFALSNVRFTGTHGGWANNGNKYFSLTSFNAAAPITVALSLTNVSVTLSGQGNGFNGTAGGSAFLHNWNNNGPVTIANSIFDERGFASTFNFLGSGASPSGSYAISNNNFIRSGSKTVRPEGNRLQNVIASVSANTFSDGSYLDLRENISAITLTSNTFSTLTSGFGIRVTSPNTGAAPTLTGTNVFTGTGLPLKYVNTAANSSYTLSGAVTVSGTAFSNLIAGGQGADTISGTTNADWINGDNGADSISGLDGNDSILGGVGADTINGGLGVDTLTGGANADAFVYNATNEGQDVITDFTVAGVVANRDTFRFSSSAFGSLPLGTLNAANFTTTTPSGAVPTFIYSGGVLSYDADGTGGGAAVNIATLTGSPALTNAFITIF